MTTCMWMRKSVTLEIIICQTLNIFKCSLFSYFIHEDN